MCITMHFYYSTLVYPLSVFSCVLLVSAASTTTVPTVVLSIFHTNARTYASLFLYSAVFTGATRIIAVTILASIYCVNMSR